jgi:alanine racemase
MDVGTSRLEINLAAIDRNVGILRQVLDASRADQTATPAGSTSPKPPRVGLCGVIKQNAYGLGAPRMARKLAALGTDLLAVYGIDELRDLADAPIDTPILALMPVRSLDRADPVYRLAVRGRLHLTLHDVEQTAELASLASRLGVKVPVHIQLDTGMSRGGALEPEASKIIDAVLSCPRLHLAGLMTHFSSPGSDDAFTREQARNFRTWIESHKPRLGSLSGLWIHAANTAAALRGRSLHGNMVRVGQGLYGYGFESFSDPLSVEFASFGKQLQPAVRWLSKIVHVHEIPKGAAVGYGRSFKTARPSRVALVPVGYAAGFPIGLSSNPQTNTPVGKVALTGLMFDRPRGGETVEVFERPALAPVIGRVSMDQITIDVTGLPDSLAKVGAEIELIGADAQSPTHLPTVAKAAGTISHDILCRVSPSIERVYLTGATSSAGHSGPGGAGGVASVPRLPGPAARVPAPGPLIELRGSAA